MLRSLVRIALVIGAFSIMQINAGTSSVSAHVANPELANSQTVVLQYLQSKGYSGASFPSGPYSSSCPSGERCIFGSIVLVPYEITGSNGGGVALVAMGTLTNPNAGTVLGIGGGAMDLNDIESYGVVASQATALINQFNN